MNERIREIERQSGIEIYGLGLDRVKWESTLEKFAELIVEECVNRVRSRQMFAIEDNKNVNHAFDLLVYDIKSHFGVE